MKYSSHSIARATGPSSSPRQSRTPAVNPFGSRTPLERPTPLLGVGGSGRLAMLALARDLDLLALLDAETP